MKNFILIILVSLIAGCAANIKQSVKTSNMQQGAIPNSISVAISSSNSISKSRDLTKSITELNTLITTDYKGNLIPSNSSNQADISVEITIEHFRYVSGFGRFMAGVMVGDAELMLNVKLVDLSTNQIFSESQLDTRSEFSEGIFGATTSRQLEAMSKKIVDIINSSAKNS